MLKERDPKTEAAANFAARLWRLRNHPISMAVVMLLICILGLILRYEDASDWERIPHMGLSPDGEYYSTTYDGYYYLSIARDINEGTPGASEFLKGVPDRDPLNRSPLLSVLIGLGSHWSGVSENHLGAILIPVLGVLVAIPVYFIGLMIGGRVMGLSAALFTLTAPYLLYRSAVGWIDTDALNPFFAMTAAVLFGKFAVTTNSRRYLYLGYGLALWLVFLWWWDMAPGPVTLITFLPLSMALILYYRAPRSEWRWMLGGGILVGIIVMVLVDVPALINKSVAKLLYVAKTETGDFPNIGVSISEQSRAGIHDLVAGIASQEYVLILIGVGLVWMLIARPRLSLVLLPLPLTMLGMAVMFAERFMIFLGPLAGLSIGFLVQRLWNLNRHWVTARAAAVCLLIGVLLPNISTNGAATRFPKPNPSLVSLLEKIRTETPRDALIWSWWDYGYPILYWSRRATLADGSYHPGEAMVHVAWPLTVSDPRSAANFMQFYSLQGNRGIHRVYSAHNNDKGSALARLKELLSKGPQEARRSLELQPLQALEELRSVEDWVKFLYPGEEQTRPIYLLLNRDMLGKAYWWFWFGTWDTERKKGDHVRPMELRGLREQNGVISRPGFTLDRARGTGEIRTAKGQQYFSIKGLSEQTGRSYRLYNYPFNGKAGGFTWYKDAGVGILYGSQIASSVFGQLYFASAIQEGWFERIFFQPHGNQLWKVNPDHYSPPKLQ